MSIKLIIKHITFMWLAKRNFMPSSPWSSWVNFYVITKIKSSLIGPKRELLQGKEKRKINVSFKNIVLLPMRKTDVIWKIFLEMFIFQAIACNVHLPIINYIFIIFKCSLQVLYFYILSGYFFLAATSSLVIRLLTHTRFTPPIVFEPCLPVFTVLHCAS